MIRPMTVEDIGYIQQIAHVTWNDTYAGIIPEDVQIAFIKSSYSDAMMMKRMEKTHLLVAECEKGTPIGFLNFTKKDEDGDSELTAMYILPTYQHSGFGKKLFDQSICMLEDAKQLFVYVDSRNTVGRSFYEKQGFELIDVFEETFEGYPVETAQYVYYIPKPVLAY
ncbi:GNAT family N-acetyltransferase [Sporosarcina thermotolerans]|uniref:GNAT family N-acetyltransferase n=1 Tax=Sporosarcina thermotolerans TaxID=633404 RepID=A0AAW9A997_9BACL|nr:GNAT family N-acetyltransferase [Sporosarcina thermotolerans]MDW0118032.1 GNAT family N-acetyltransferase [Sporosarcina thermotolerans]WHT49093.1 GNAT family N-acetyltransferase [Sporosarcina thermotolerans]